ncbi:MAG TPA: cytochrome c oxidase assembly protein [Jatrophihabitantaceae bacterium]|nr:cytochrome c oxidase assembly protein [Jatrophihabitantaceae bacterium]
MALPVPAFAGLASRTTWQPVALVVGLAIAAWYLRAARDVGRAGAPWPVRRTVVFLLGVASLLYTCCGWLEVYRRSLYWAWTGQALALLLLVPLVLLAGQPIQLARAHGGATGLVDRVIRSRFGRIVANPLVGPALVPILCAVLFFGPLPAWVAQWSPVAWVVQLALVLVGALIVLPLVGPDDAPGSLAVGLSLAIGSFELVLDAIPGIALRLHTTLTTSYFDHRATHTWSPAALHDQQISGAVVWCVAEVIDLPFLLLVFRRWVRADVREAAEVDAVLEAERAARSGLTPGDPGAAADVPWWLSDPAMQRRLGGPDR